MKLSRSSDAAALAALHGLAFDEAWSQGDMETLLSSLGVLALAVEDQRTVAGFILLRVVVDEAEIMTLASAPDRRRRGIATALVEAAALLAADLGAAALFLEVGADNHAALALYERFEFRQVGLRTAYYQRLGGAVDALVLRRDLNTGRVEPYA